MSKHYISCARCDKDLEITTSSDCYSSDIDNKLVCKECWQKEQPKELLKQINILEKALELACQNSCFEDICEYCEYKSYTKTEFGCPCYCENEQGFEIKQAINYFKETAKEMMKSEKT